jgi:DNA-binding Lrp family transcriptional regulator
VGQGLSIAQKAIMKVLTDAGELTIAELADSTGLSARQIHTAVRALASIVQVF